MNDITETPTPEHRALAIALQCEPFHVRLRLIAEFVARAVNADRQKGLHYYAQWRKAQTELKEMTARIGDRDAASAIESLCEQLTAREAELAAARALIEPEEPKP